MECLLILGPAFIDVPIPTFKAPIKFEDFNSLKAQVDSPRAGLTLIQFCSMLGECEGCERIMWIRTKDFHRCPGKNARSELAPITKLLPRLDCVSGGQGVTKLQYEYLFSSCIQCGRIFSCAAAPRHHHSDELDYDMDMF